MANPTRDFYDSQCEICQAGVSWLRLLDRHERESQALAKGACQAAMSSLSPLRKVFCGAVAGCFGIYLLGFSVAGWSGEPASPNLTTQPPPVCAMPAPANPAAGSGTYQQIAIDPAVYGTRSTAGLSVFAFSQEGWLAGPGDPQVFAMLPSIVPRAWAKWDTDGIKPSDYNFGYPAQAQADGIIFIGGTTATVLFQDEFPVAAQFNAVVSCNAQGQPVLHTGNFYRGSMASQAYRQYIIGIGEIQIDGGVDGLFFDEVSGSYQGATYNGNEGFDDADVADFGGFLCAKYPNLSATEWQSQFGVLAEDNLNCSPSPALSGRTFNYRGYLARNGWQTNPLTQANPLAARG